ncbi:MAG: alpha/beta hydrolase [Cyanobacteria bacterium P01_A01_bin.123]
MSLHAIAPKLPQSETADKLLVMLHGWGANANDLAGLATYLDLPGYRLCFPDAPFAHPQVPGGRMWYGFPLGYDFRSPPDFAAQPDLQASRQRLIDWLKDTTEAINIPLSRTVLAGFSQGGAMTLDVGPQLPLAGMMILSGYLHGALHPASSVAPVLMVHGRHDPVVPLAMAQAAQATLIDQGVSVQYHEINMGHEVQLEVLTLMQRFCEDL